MSTNAPPLYRLRGEIGGRVQVFDLRAGEATAGSARDNDVRLRAAGVSRRHAAIRANAEGLVIEDLGSKNGTSVDGRRILRAAAGAGSRIGFGPVVLTVEAPSAGEGLAIRFEDPPDESSLAELERAETPLVQVDAGGDERGLATVEGLLSRLSAEDVGRALPYLCEALGLEGACLVEWNSSDEPLARASWGSLKELPPLERIRRLPSNGVDDGVWRCGAFASEGRGLLAVRMSGRGEQQDLARGLVVWRGDAAAEISARLLRVLLRLLCASQGDSVGFAEPDVRAEPALRFPAGYQAGESEAMRDLYRQMAALSRSRRPVLLHGETGVGKELLSRALHDSSPHAEKPYVVVNCAAVPENLLEAEMFGIVKGAATGIEPRDGYFVRAHGGTLVLDEIGELTPALQAKLLRTLQEKEIQPVGGSPRPVDVWVIAVTHVDLFGDKLRRDLYYRLAGGLLEVPPLRRCPDDVPALVRHFLASAAAEAGTALRGVTVRALGRLRSYRWPGNVRELEQVMHRLATSRPPGGIVDEDDLPEEIRLGDRHAADPEPSAESEDLALKPRVEALERALIREAMRRAGGRQVRAAKLLGVSRSGLDKMLKRLNLKDSWARPDGD